MNIKIPYLILPILFCIYSCRTSKNYKNWTVQCDSTFLSENNLLNDTSKVVLTGTGVFDTSICVFRGIISDNVTLIPIKKAHIELYSSELKFDTFTDDNGEFKFINNGICSDTEWKVRVSHLSYKCMIVKYTPFIAGIWISIKLKKTK